MTFKMAIAALMLTILAMGAFGLAQIAQMRMQPALHLATSR